MISIWLKTEVFTENVTLNTCIRLVTETSQPLNSITSESLKLHVN